jgi:hypothetical protein
MSGHLTVPEKMPNQYLFENLLMAQRKNPEGDSLQGFSNQFSQLIRMLFCLFLQLSALGYLRLV